MLNSEQLLGEARQRFEELEEKGYDWKSFVAGWKEGRLDLLNKELKAEVCDARDDDR